MRHMMVTFHSHLLHEGTQMKLGQAQTGQLFPSLALWEG
jgi:hypothetical protein